MLTEKEEKRIQKIEARQKWTLFSGVFVSIIMLCGFFGMLGIIWKVCSVLDVSFWDEFTRVFGDAPPLDQTYSGFDIFFCCYMWMALIQLIFLLLVLTQMFYWNSLNKLVLKCWHEIRELRSLQARPQG